MLKMMYMKADVEKFVKFCDSKFGKRVMKKEARYVSNVLKDCEKILALGCGIGSFEQNLPYLNIIGLDSSKEMLQEAKRRSNKDFVLADAGHLGVKNSAFDAVFIVTTLEFLENYQRAVEETARVTQPCGRILAMMLNPMSEYFQEEVKRPDDYFRRIKHTNLREVRDYISQFFTIIQEENFLGIRRQRILNTNDERYASLYVVVGIKR